MEQKSKQLKRRTKKGPSETQTDTTTTTTTASTSRYSLRNRKKESPPVKSKRSQKRKVEQEKQHKEAPTTQKKIRTMENNTSNINNSKGKQKAEDKPTSSHATEKKEKMDTEEHSNDDIHENEEEHQSEHEDEEEPKHEFDEEEDEDEDEDDDDEELSRVRRTLGLRMQGLFGGMMSSDFGRFKSILTSLKNNDDPTMQLIALQELAEILSVSSEENLIGYFSSDGFSRELIRIMKGPDDMLPEDTDMDEDMMLALAMSEGFSGGNPEVMLLACRCISNLLEAMPTAVTSIVSHGAIRVLCQKLKSIQYIDLAEQALYALEKIAAQLPRAVVNEGGLSAALMYFDFFSIHAQRTALRTASNCMRGIDMDSFSQVLEVTPTLMNTITYSDRSIIELTCLCWVRISEGYRSNRECLERAVNVDLLKILYGLMPVPGNPNAVHPGTFQDLLRIFRAISKASPQLSFELLKLGVVESFYQILTGASSVPDFEKTNAQHHISLDSKWRDSVPTIMKIIVDLLPSLPKDNMFSSRRFKSNHNSPVACRTRSSSANNTKNTTIAETTIDPRVQWFNENPEVLLKLDHILIPLILDMYASTVNLRVRQLVTRTLVKLLHYSDPEILSKVLKNVTLSSFLSGILTRQEHPVLLIDALYQTELMIQKLPQIYHFLFEREGVLHEIDSLSKLPYVDEEENANQQSQKKESDSLPNTQPSEDTNNTTIDESDGTTTDADNTKRESSSNDKQGEDDEDVDEDDDDDHDESNNDDECKKNGKSTSSKSVGTTSSSSGLRSPSSSASQRRLFDSADLQAMMRNHHLLQHQQRVSRHHNHYSENEKGVGRGSTRKYIIQLAQHFVQHYFNKMSEDGTPLASTGSSLKEILQFTNELMAPTDQDPASEQTLINLSAYLRDSIMGISSFELINTGLMKALLVYLTQSGDGQWKTPLNTRIQLFERIFVDQPDIDADGNNALKKLVVRLQEILSRSEAFEVVTPLESSSGTDNLRNPTSMLAKQLRLRLSGTGEDIPTSYKQLMVSTHAVATFRVLEDYLLARIGASSSLTRGIEDDDDDEDEEGEDEVEVDEEDHLLIEDENSIGHMDVDEDPDTIMSEAVVVKKDETEGEDEDDTQEQPTKEDIKASSSTNTKQTASSSDTNKKDGKWKIRFSLNGSVVSNDSTVYAAVHQYEMNASEGRSIPTSQPRLSGRNIWASSYPVTYERIWVSHTGSDEESKKSSSSVVRQLADISLPKNLKEDSTCYQVLQLLKALSPAITKQPDGINAQDFINRKLTAKANRQLEEPLIVASSCLPNWIYWLMAETPFIFPFETRYLFIQSTSFGYARLIARWQSLQMRNNSQNGPRNDTSDQQPVLGRMERQKVRIMRTQMLESAIKILNLFGTSPTVLEIEYMGEEGTGMGPTLEFYASTSKEFSKHSLNMWRGSNKVEKGYVQSSSGLFPKTLAKSNSRSTKKIVHLFKALGQFIAKGLLDFRIIDIPFSSAFFKVALDDMKPSRELLKEIDSQLAKSINMLQSYINQKREIYADKSKSSEEKSEAVKEIQVDNAKLEDLCLDFTLPGDATYDLKAGGSDIPVTIHNVEEYIDLVQDAIVGSGITQQITAFREGFNGLFAIDDLKLLTHTELVSLFGKADEDWSYATLAGTMRADHGFTMDSDPVRYLLEILSDFSDIEKRQFLQFTTGSPRLPIGGWKALRPVFTVVRKIPEAPLTADDYLPSVMTCANYFKMPAYTSKEITRQRLLTSMEEGQNSFLLS